MASIIRQIFQIQQDGTKNLVGGSWSCFNIKSVFPGNGIPITKIVRLKGWLWDHVISIIKIDYKELFVILSTMADDDVVTKGARASLATLFCENVTFSIMKMLFAINSYICIFSLF